MTAERPTATWRALGLELALDEPEALLRERAARAAGVDPAALRGLRIARKSLDARRRGGERRLRFVCNVDLVLDAGTRGRGLQRAVRSGRVRPAPATGSLLVEGRDPAWERARAVVVGAGPAGLFAALVLARNGAAVTLLERGPEVQARSRAVVRFHRTREVDPERNLLFGEGGAGTYSDGKIYTRVDDALEVPLLEELVACGAPPEITYDSLAHIGTDRLHRILPRLRARLEQDGVEFRFDTRLEGLVTRPGATGPTGEGTRVAAVCTTAGELACDLLVLAVGHSARDTWTRLAAEGVLFEGKPFQLGLRIEHPQELVDRARYGEAAAGLGAASYNLVSRAEGGLPAAYSFCMCPGGRIVAAIHEAGLLCTNGMSNSRHSSGRATAALVTTFGPEHFGNGPFDGVRFQRELEARFFEAGGGDYTAPAQTAADFLAGRRARETARSTWPFGTRPERLDRLLPDPAPAAIALALERFDRQIPGFAGEQGLLVGLESRSSGPVRIPRDARYRALGFANLLPVGEGAGYAGGIMSAALDGARAAQAALVTGPGA